MVNDAANPAGGISGMEVLTFYLNGEMMALPLANIAEVNRMGHLRHIPEASRAVMGVINFHGTTAPVLNLKELLSLCPSVMGGKAMWIAVRTGEEVVCLAVDALGPFMRLEASAVDSAPVFLQQRGARYIRYMARADRGLIWVLDPVEILESYAREVETGGCLKACRVNTPEGEPLGRHG